MRFGLLLLASGIASGRADTGARARLRYQIHPRVWVAAATYGSGLPVNVDGAIDIPSLVSQYGQQIIDRVNFSAGRVRPNFTLDASLGADLWKREQRSLTLQLTGDNLADRLNVINFTGPFRRRHRSAAHWQHPLAVRVFSEAAL